MSIGEESSAVYAGFEDGKLLFRLLPSLETIRVTADNVIGSSILNQAQQFVLHRNTVSVYTVSVAS